MLPIVICFFLINNTSILQCNMDDFCHVDYRNYNSESINWIPSKECFNKKYTSKTIDISMIKDTSFNPIDFVLSKEVKNAYTLCPYMKFLTISNFRYLGALEIDKNQMGFIYFVEFKYLPSNIEMIIVNNNVITSKIRLSSIGRNEEEILRCGSERPLFDFQKSTIISKSNIVLYQYDRVTVYDETRSYLKKDIDSCYIKIDTGGFINVR